MFCFVFLADADVGGFTLDVFVEEEGSGFLVGALGGRPIQLLYPFPDAEGHAADVPHATALLPTQHARVSNASG